MLVMYTLNQTVSSKLPQTSTIRFIDIWTIFGHFLHFLILVLLILIEHLPEEVGISVFNHGMDQKINNKRKYWLKAVTLIIARKVLPIIETLFVICYAIAAYFIYTFQDQ